MTNLIGFTVCEKFLIKKTDADDDNDNDVGHDGAKGNALFPQL
jgi:hypothetical protein